MIEEGPLTLTSDLHMRVPTQAYVQTHTKERKVKGDLLEDEWEGPEEGEGS